MLRRRTDRGLRRRGARGTPRAGRTHLFSEPNYRAAFCDPAIRHAMRANYRSAMVEEVAHDDADHAAGR